MFFYVNIIYQKLSRKSRVVGAVSKILVKGERDLDMKRNKTI